MIVGTWLTVRDSTNSILKYNHEAFIAKMIFKYCYNLLQNNDDQSFNIIWE